MKSKVTWSKLFSLWLPVVFWAALIFVGSAIPNADFSSDQGTERIIHLIAHLLEYSIFSFLIVRALYSSWGKNFRLVASLFSLAISFIYAISDEFHQLFTPGRMAKWSDVGNDTIGALFGIVCFWLLYYIYKNLPFPPKKFISYSARWTRWYGGRLAKKLRGGEVILLRGDLGSGKTELVKGLALGLGSWDRVLSPTFVLQRIYQGDELRLVHTDLYRLTNKEEVLDLCLLDVLLDSKTVLVVEWPERGGDIWPEKSRCIDFEYLSGNKRRLVFKK